MKKGVIRHYNFTFNYSFLGVILIRLNRSVVQGGIIYRILCFVLVFCLCLMMVEVIDRNKQRYGIDLKVQRVVCFVFVWISNVDGWCTRRDDVAQIYYLLLEYYYVTLSLMFSYKRCSFLLLTCQMIYLTKSYHKLLQGQTTN